MQLENRYNWKEFQKRNDEGESPSKIKREYGMAQSTYNKAISLKLIKPHRVKRNQSQLTKDLISFKRIEWLKNNPEKHPWRSNNKFKSVPCEQVKNFLKQIGIPFLEEFQPNISNRCFSIDIAFPDKMIALEINGNQHYQKDGTLKPYYQERHNILKINGWNVYEIHYSHCFNFEKWIDFVELLKNSISKINFDYFNYIPIKFKNKKINVCSNCNLEISYKAKKCQKCHSFYSRKIKVRPNKDELKNLLNEFPMTNIGKQFGVSDNTIRKWCKTHNLL